MKKPEPKKEEAKKPEPKKSDDKKPEPRKKPEKKGDDKAEVPVSQDPAVTENSPAQEEAPAEESAPVKAEATLPASEKVGSRAAGKLWELASGVTERTIKSWRSEARPLELVGLQFTKALQGDAQLSLVVQLPDSPLSE